MYISVDEVQRKLDSTITDQGLADKIEYTCNRIDTCLDKIDRQLESGNQLSYVSPLVSIVQQEQLNLDRYKREFIKRDL